MISPSKAPSSRTSRASVSRPPEVPMLRGSARSGCARTVWVALTARVCAADPGRDQTRTALAGLARPELAVAGVTEPGHDVALLVQLAIQRRRVNLHVGMGRGDRLDALGRRDEVDELDPDGRDRAPLLQDL